MERLQDHPEFTNWTPAEGRWLCFSEIRGILAPLLPGNNSIEPPRGASIGTGLLNTIASSLAYQMALSTAIPFELSHAERHAHLHKDLGFITPLGSARHDVYEDTANKPYITLQSPIRPVRSFEQVVAAPRIGYKVHSIASPSPTRGASAVNKGSPIAKPIVLDFAEAAGGNLGRPHLAKILIDNCDSEC